VEQAKKKNILKPGLYRSKIAEKQSNWPSRIPSKANYFKLKGGSPVYTRTKIKTSFEALPENFA